MSRRTVSHPAVVGPVLVWAVLLGFVPQIVEAAPLPPAPVGQPVEDRPSDEARAAEARLVALGLSPAEAAAHLAALSDEERQALVARLDEVGAGGSAAGAIAVAIVLALLVILVLELMGRRVISRP